jgi:hypothetical protein
MDSLVDFYSEILSNTYKESFSRKENRWLDDELIIPLKSFLMSLDTEFKTDYFFQKIKNLKRTYVIRKYVLKAIVLDEEKNSVEKAEIKIYDNEHAKLRQLITTLSTDKSGFVETELAEGSYLVEIEKYSLRKSCELNRNSTLYFTKPSFNLIVRIYDDKNKPKRNIEVYISSVEKNSKSKPMYLKADKKGYIGTRIPFGFYKVGIRKYFMERICELTDNKELVFVLPKKKHWWQ